MGCFSFLCQECGNGINSDSFRGEECILFLLKDGKVIEQLEGEYDSYGRVFNEFNSESIKWSLDWNNICNLMFGSNEENGIAAFHKDCYNGEIPTVRSDDDPDQGWNEFKSPKKEGIYCCSQMQSELNRVCENHINRFDCPDNVIHYNKKRNKYGLIIHDGGSSYYNIDYCPFCGKKL